jgi:hypothetical protein
MLPMSKHAGLKLHGGRKPNFLPEKAAPSVIAWLGTEMSTSVVFTKAAKLALKVKKPAKEKAQSAQAKKRAKKCEPVFKQPVPDTPLPSTVRITGDDGSEQCRPIVWVEDLYNCIEIAYTGPD